MKKRMLAVLLVLLVCTVSAFADGIRVNPRETIANRNLSGDVTNILILLQDGDVTNLCAIASINGKSGKGVITQLDPDLMVNVPEAGDVRLGDVYSLGDAKSRGFLTVRTVNQLLDLNIATYVALDMTQIPALVDALEGFIFTPSKEEDAALGFDEDTWALDGEQTLAYMRLKLDSDEPGMSRSYNTMVAMVRQAMYGDVLGLMGVGSGLLKSMDTNLNAMSAIGFATSIRGGSEHIEMSLPRPEDVTGTDPLTADTESMRAFFAGVVY